MQVATMAGPSFSAWRALARKLLGGGVPPEELLWEDGSGGGSLFDEPASAVPGGSASAARIPRAFIALAKLVACHRDAERWALLYRAAWRITRGGEGHLLELSTDEDVRRLERWASAVRRDRHKMTAFVRFRKVGDRGCGSGGAREQFVAWFEPDHHVMELAAAFFADRFAGMDWSILTPSRCAHWDGASLRFTPGVARDQAPPEDALDDYWRSYYAHIFNPARLKLGAMRAEMPAKYWRNLPEAPLIAELSRSSAGRAGRMIDAPDSAKAHVSEPIPCGVPTADAVSAPPLLELPALETTSLAELRERSGGCEGCPLHHRATHAVFGEGPEDAELMIVGEQPGDEEDLAGRPFVGPAGRLLDRGLAEAGIDRENAYVTNVVKHFKWKRRGKRRLHETPSAGEVTACKP